MRDVAKKMPIKFKSLPPTLVRVVLAIKKMGVLLVFVDTKVAKINLWGILKRIYFNLIILLYLNSFKCYHELTVSLLPSSARWGKNLPY